MCSAEALAYGRGQILLLPLSEEHKDDFRRDEAETPPLWAHVLSKIVCRTHAGLGQRDKYLYKVRSLRICFPEASKKAYLVHVLVYFLIFYFLLPPPLCRINYIAVVFLFHLYMDKTG